ncbi:hypothetical protein AAFF_G00405860 [Aldrovandia affinis]|uniref:Uncharacterized protein n=1 Tax=Aldrovandia affinis TaxID=143900 RepID=A0AAD7SC11_9TELE|nr:hypothetical protein AAFF_G00405860 [Aldrovandia affinis]
MWQGCHWWSGVGTEAQREEGQPQRGGGFFHRSSAALHRCASYTAESGKGHGRAWGLQIGRRRSRRTENFVN